MSAEDGENKGPGKQDRWWKRLWKDHQKAVTGALAVPLLALVTFFGNELVDTVTDRFDPTEATVTGKVLRQGDGLSGAAVVLWNAQGRPAHRSVTDSAGTFIFVKVNDGLYRLDVSNQEILLFSLHVHVVDDIPSVPVDTIDIATMPQLPEPAPEPTGAPVATEAAVPTTDGDADPTGSPAASPAANGGPAHPDAPWFQVIDIDTIVPLLPRGAPTLVPAGEATAPAPTPAPPPGTPAATSLALVYEWEAVPVAGGEAPQWTVRAGLSATDGVASVTYYLNPAFQPSVVTRYADTGFDLEFETRGSFELGALVQFEDGRELYLTVPIELLQR